MSRMKPMSSIRSASSRTRISTARQVDRALADVVEQAARASRRRSRRRCAGRGPAARSRRRRRWRPSGSGRCRAVGADALLDLEGELAGRREDRARGRRGAPSRRALAWRRWSIGSTNAAVLPVPVWAPASRSRPARTSGMASRLDGGGHGVALSGDRAEELGRQPETIEGHGGDAPDEGPSRTLRGPVRAIGGSGSDGMRPGRRPERPSSTSVP